MPHILKISKFWAWLFGSKPRKAGMRLDKGLEELDRLVGWAASSASMHAYATAPALREAMVNEWSGFREKAEELSRPFPHLRPMWGRLHLALEDLAIRGRQGCLPPESYGKVLFSEKNVCHSVCCEVQALADRIRKAILNYETGG